MTLSKDIRYKRIAKENKTLDVEGLRKITMKNKSNIGKIKNIVKK